MSKQEQRPLQVLVGASRMDKMPAKALPAKGKSDEAGQAATAYMAP